MEKKKKYKIKKPRPGTYTYVRVPDDYVIMRALNDAATAFNYRPGSHRT